MAYCGYADLSMVIMYIVFGILVISSIILGLYYFSSVSVLLVSLKVFNMGFFGDMEFYISVWGIMFVLLVIFISMSVVMFSFAYMNGYLVSNFIMLYLSFVGSMVWLVLSSNFYWMMLGWDGLGVASFLLIVFYMNCESINNGLFTLFQNRIGDLFFVFFMLGMLDMCMMSNLSLKIGLLLLVIGACVKSAQFPFNAWLLSAMSAPTPISSLVHSSTLVVAGVYILLQYSYCMVDMLVVLKFISFFTLILSGVGLLNEYDMKKLIAYSTMSHIALMMYMYSFGLFKVVYFHLNIHAMFKSLMFMCFGFSMLVSYHAQDKRMVSFLLLNPMIKMIYYFSCLCLAGLPFLSGFFSKDLIIEKFMENNIEFMFLVSLLVFLGISVYYSMKLLSLSNVLFSYSIIEWSLVSMGGISFMLTISIVVINMYISMVFSVSLEMVSSKLYIYFVMMIMFILSVMTKLNYKFSVYDKIMNFKEVWMVNVVTLDKFMYWNMFMLLEFVSMMSKMKLVLLMNWWVCVMVIMLI